MTREEAVIILDGFKNNPLFNEQHFEALDMAISALSAEPCREVDDYENEIADLHNRLDIAEYDKERLREEITILEAESKEVLTNEKAIAFLQDNGWLVEHDRIMTSGMENEGEWIPVSERLPEKKVKDYLACCEDGYVATIMYDNGRWLINGNNVIAWMPLPEPYKAEKPETCKGCLEPCIMYEPNMRACKKKVKAESDE